MTWPTISLIALRREPTSSRGDFTGVESAIFFDVPRFRTVGRIHLT
jgi:hypothetical protein